MPHAPDRVDSSRCARAVAWVRLLRTVSSLALRGAGGGGDQAKGRQIGARPGHGGPRCVDRAGAEVAQLLQSSQMHTSTFAMQAPRHLPAAAAQALPACRPACRT